MGPLDVVGDPVATGWMWTMRVSDEAGAILFSKPSAPDPRDVPVTILSNHATIGPDPSDVPATSLSNLYRRMKAARDQFRARSRP